MGFPISPLSFYSSTGANSSSYPSSILSFTKNPSLLRQNTSSVFRRLSIIFESIQGCYLLKKGFTNRNCRHNCLSLRYSETKWRIRSSILDKYYSKSDKFSCDVVSIFNSKKEVIVALDTKYCFTDFNQVIKKNF